MSEKSVKSTQRTPKSCRSKHASYKNTPSTSSAKLHMEFIPSPKKASSANITYKNIEDEEYPRGFTLLETLSSPSKETIHSDHELESHASEKDLRSVRTGSSSGPKELSLIAEFDELIRIIQEYITDDLCDEFLAFAEHQELCRLEWLKSVRECRRLQAELDKANHEIGDFQTKLKNARRLLDRERKFRRKVEDDRFHLQQQMITARDLLFADKSWRLPDDTREKLSFLNSSMSKSSVFERNIVTLGNRLDTINEINSADINSTASLLSEFSCSRSEGELDTSTVFKIKTTEWKQPNIIKKQDKKSPKRLNTAHKVVEINPNDKIVATTTLAMSKDGPITATSVIEAVPRSESDVSQESEISEIPKDLPKLPSPTLSVKKPHNFVSKTVICPDICSACQTRIRFGKLVAKCKDCRNICHIECKKVLVLPCIPVMNTPTNKPTLGTLSDYTPNTSPMVPALIIHCINEIELRGFKEIGLYRIPGAEKDIRVLKEKLLRSKFIPDLKDIDVHVLCGIVKDFLRSLKEPLVTYLLRKNFIRSSEARDEMDVSSCLYQCISQLPQPNRDTLAYIMLHLNRVAASRDCKMPSSNLSKIFGPAIVGYSSENVEAKQLLPETKQQVLVMEKLMKIPIDFWSSFINNVDSAMSTPRNQNLSSTPSTSSVLRVSSRRRFFPPEENSPAQSARKRKKYFGTPPMSYKK